MHLDDLLKIMVDRGSSDLHLKVGIPPTIRVDGKLFQLEMDRFTPDVLENLIFQVLDEKQKQNYLQNHELDFSYSVPGVARFRGNVSQQRGTIRMVMRLVPFKIPTLEELHLPDKVLKYLAFQPSGIVLLTGPTGTGKSTTLAAVIDFINNSRNTHIVTVEDPIEFLYRDKKSIITQREVGVDTNSFAIALRHVLRQDPDVVLIGEMRDLETISTAITAAETGHLVFSTLHTNEAAQTIDRIVDAFPPYQQEQIRIQISSTLQGIITQRLLPRVDGQGRVPAVEILIATPLVRKLILEKASPARVYEQILQGSYYGMQTLNQSLTKLIQTGLIRKEEAYSVSPNPDELSLLLRGVFSGPGGSEGGSKK